MFKNIHIEGISFGFIVKSNITIDKTEFVTEKHLPLQFACMKFNKGESITPHIHNKFNREVCFTNEVLIIKSGKVRVKFYNYNQIEIHSELLQDGDIIFLQDGGHSFDIIDDSVFFEIKNGPYHGQELDKIKF